MKTEVTLPSWLDNLIFDELGAKYCRSNSDMTVIDWNRKDILNYLGTYFPRSYAEAYCLYSVIFDIYANKFRSKKELSVFDFGCGTGGEIIGMADAVAEYMSEVDVLKVNAFDGNQHALYLLESIAQKYNDNNTLKIDLKIIPFEIDDIYDLSILKSVMTGRIFDFVMTFKSVCEFVTKQRFEEKNAYVPLLEFFLSHLANDGIVLLDDVSTYNDISQEWLPRMMNAAIEKCKCEIIKQNVGYNQSFHVRHSRCSNDLSKIAWRIINQTK